MDIEVDVGVIGVIFSELRVHGIFEAGVFGIVGVPIGSVATAGVGNGGGRLPPEERVKEGGKKSSGAGNDGHSLQ